MHSSPLQAALQQQKLAAGAGVGSKNVWVAIKVVRLCPVPGSVGGGSKGGSAKERRREGRRGESPPSSTPPRAIAG